MSPHGAAPYGTSSRPGTPGTWDREVWWALNRAARVGRGTGRHRWRLTPPFDYGSLHVTATAPVPAYGISTHGKHRLTHLPHTLLFAWRGEALAGRMVAWHCGARTAYFQLGHEATTPLCQMCVFQQRGRQAQCGRGRRGDRRLQRDDYDRGRDHGQRA